MRSARDPSTSEGVPRNRSLAWARATCGRLLAAIEYHQIEVMRT